jgi:hypothetical protein
MPSGQPARRRRYRISETCEDMTFPTRSVFCSCYSGFELSVRIVQPALPLTAGVMYPQALVPRFEGFHLQLLVN